MLIQLILTLALLGLVVYLIETFIPMSPPFKLLIRIIVVVVVILYLLKVFGLMAYDIPLPKP